MRSESLRVTLLLLFCGMAVLGSAMACHVHGRRAGRPERTDKSRVPADHTKGKDGILHKPGAKHAQQNCTPCHGADLKGAESRPSCYACHDVEWRE